MTPKDYVAAVLAVGVKEGLPVQEFDRQAALLLQINERTARRYRTGKVVIPGPVQVALRVMGSLPRRP
jgi:hypothetical protein